ncbi:unnamed protein product [Meganyctiphanes norvegica]|uniref:Uncharacterized protein n=1 Tax=Meganyctiphanes norvegica TaxID=48144 RepID=A0AAV2PLJ8_MEGNR
MFWKCLYIGRDFNHFIPIQTHEGQKKNRMIKFISNPPWITSKIDVIKGNFTSIHSKIHSGFILGYKLKKLGLQDIQNGLSNSSLLSKRIVICNYLLATLRQL